jgi:hypothetical protein
MPPPRIVQVVVRAIVAAILGAVWLFAAVMFLTGFVMWRDWHALAKDGVDHEARVTSCVFESMHTSKRVYTSSSGYYSCNYQYTLSGSDTAYSGYFQSPRDWKAGEPTAIRYRRDQPSASATLDNLKNPSVTPAALMLLPLLYAGWQFRAPLRRALGRLSSR